MTLDLLVAFLALALWLPTTGSALALAATNSAYLNERKAAFGLRPHALPQIVRRG